ncbi:MAG: peptidylprolyl isomerase [archaeon]
MADKVQKGDFVKIDYVGRIKATNRIFDLTDEALAKKENIYDKEQEYKPKTVVVGARHIIHGLDEKIDGLEIGKKVTIDVAPSNGFGSRNPEFIKVFPVNRFKDQKVPLVPGAPVQIGGIPGTISSVSGGRVRVDFNHPLAGRELAYEITVVGKITDKKEKVNGLLDLHYGAGNFGINFEGKNLEITIPDDVKQEWMRAKSSVISDALEYLGVEKVRLIEEFQRRKEPSKKESQKK